MIVQSPLGIWNLDKMTFLNVDANKSKSRHVIKVHWSYAGGLMGGGDHNIIAAFTTRDEADEMMRRIGIALAEGIPFINVDGIGQVELFYQIRQEVKEQDEARRAQEENE